MSKDDHAPASPEEQRALSRDEQELADQARQPVLGDLSDRDLSDLVTRLRERRNRARDIGDRQGREARGKADPSGTSAAVGNLGMRSKLDFLNDALNRAVSERDSRGAADAEDQVDLAQKAMALKQQASDNPAPVGENGPPHPNDEAADPGMGAMDDTARRTAPSGAFDHAGELPARERSGHRG